MSKKVFNFVPDIVGWYQPHIAVNWDGMIADPKTGELVKEPSMTKQSHKDECDVNLIVKRFEQPGFQEAMLLRAEAGLYLDLPDPVDFQGALELVRRAEDAFGSMSAAVRARFGNDPTQLLGFLSDPANQEEAIKLGLAVDNRPPPPAPPQKVEIVNPPDDLKSEK